MCECGLCFFFKQKTAYEMRISDWSSDVCSPDLQDQTTSAPAIKIKKYANRRLYNTATSSYVTLENLCQMVKDGQDFVVEDAKTGDDITRSVQLGRASCRERVCQYV